MRTAAVTIQNAAGQAVTQAALTATTTTTTVAASSSRRRQHRMARVHTTTHWKPSLLSRYVFGPQLAQHNSAHAAQVAAATATAAAEAQASLPGVERDIELHPARVAQVVQQAKEAGELQQQQLAEGQTGGNTQAATAAEKSAVSTPHTALKVS